MNGQQKSKIHVARVQAWIASSQALPRRKNGRLNRAEFARILAVPRDSLYKNPTVAALIEAAITRELDRIKVCPAVAKDKGSGKQSVDKNSSASMHEQSFQTQWHEAVKKVQSLEKRLAKTDMRSALLKIESDAKSEFIRELQQQIFRQEQAFNTGRLWKNSF